MRWRRYVSGFAAALWMFAATGAAAQRGATGPVADLNAKASALVDSAPEQSLSLALQAQAAAHEARDVRGEAEAYNYIAFAHRSQGLLDLARRDAQESLRLYVAAGDRWGEAQADNALGLIEADAGRFADALEYHLKALAIREQDADKEGLSYTYNNLGNMYRNMGEYAKALDYHERGLELKIELGNKSSEAYSHHNIGLVYFEMKDYANALAAYRRGLAIREQLNDPRAVAISLNAIGQVEALTNPAEALRTYERTLTLRRQSADQRGEMATLLNLADVHRQMGQLAAATAAVNSAMALGDHMDAPLMKSNALKALAEIDAARGDYAAAYRHRGESQDARDRIFNQETVEKFHNLEVAHELERHQQQILLLERESAVRDAELRRVRTTRTALAVIAALVAISLGLLYAQKQKLIVALERVQTLRGLLPICAWCKKIRDDKGYWTQVEAYIAGHTDAEFTHCICPACYTTMASDESGVDHTAQQRR